MGITDRIDRILTSVGKAFSWMSALLIVYMLVHIVIEIILRAFFDTSSFVLEEFVGYALGAMIFMALASTHQEGHLIRVSLLTNILGPRGKQIVDTLANGATLFVCVILFSGLYNVFSRNLKFGITSASFAETPLWIPQSAIVLGLGFYCVRLAFNVVICATQSIKTKG